MQKAQFSALFGRGDVVQYLPETISQIYLEVRLILFKIHRSVHHITRLQREIQYTQCHSQNALLPDRARSRLPCTN